MRLSRRSPNISTRRQVTSGSSDRVSLRSFCPPDLARILEKISALRTKEFTDEDSLTFHLLNQEDTAFEKQLHKRRKQPGKQTY